MKIAQLKAIVVYFKQITTYNSDVTFQIEETVNSLEQMVNYLQQHFNYSLTITSILSTFVVENFFSQVRANVFFPNYYKFAYVY